MAGKNDAPNSHGTASTVETDVTTNSKTDLIGHDQDSVTIGPPGPQPFPPKTESRSHVGIRVRRH
jgi:hypothetical protein